jgi:hypothetical protein
MQMSEDEKQVGTSLSDSDTDVDDELKAMRLVVAALKPLQEEQRTRVLEYVLGRFGAVPLQTQMGPAVIAASTSGAAAGSAHAGQVHDIRTLKETKNPRSANEMAALVAYYVSEVAPAGERRDAITKVDIEKYFKSGVFKLPADASFTLVNAKNAGYLDSVGGGHYKLNPVGYNLVAHRMGSDQKKKTRRK